MVDRSLRENRWYMYISIDHNYFRSHPDFFSFYCKHILKMQVSNGKANYVREKSSSCVYEWKSIRLTIAML